MALITSQQNKIMNSAEFKKYCKDREPKPEKSDEKPATTQPATTQPATTQPATTQPATTQPATTQPAKNPQAPAPAPGPAVTGNAGQTGTTAAKAGLNRPDTTSSMVSDVEESHNRLGSADIRNRPGSASAMGRQQDVSYTNVISKEEVIAEDPAENDEDRFIIRRTVI